MRTALLTIAAAALLVAPAWAGASNVRPITPTYDSLQDFFDTHVTGATYDYVDDQEAAALFHPTGTGSVTSFVFSSILGGSFSVGDEFGVYSPVTGMLVPVFDLGVAESASFPAATVSFLDFDLDGVMDDVVVAKNVPVMGTGVIEGVYTNFGPATFGYYTAVDLGGGAATHYTEDDKNGDKAWALTFQGHGGVLAMPGGLIDVAFDSNHWMVAFDTHGNGDDFDDLIVVAESIAPIPEPTSLILIGAGLLGFGLLRRRKRS